MFAQRSAPGVRYTLQSLKDAINNSIRGARYHIRKTNALAISAMDMLSNNNLTNGDLQQDNTQLNNHNNQMDTDE